MRIRAKKIRRLILAAAIILVTSPICYAASVELTWTPNTDSVDTYRVYQTQTENVWSASVATIIAPTAIYNSPTLPGGAYWFAITAVKDGAESAKSISAKASIPPNTPTGLKAVIKN